MNFMNDETKPEVKYLSIWRLLNQQNLRADGRS